MTLNTPAGPLVLADNPHDLLSRNYFWFQQGWAREVGIGSDLYAQDGHLARLGLFLGKDNDAARAEYNHTVLGFRNLTAEVPVNYRAEALAPLVLSLDGRPCVADTLAAVGALAGRLAGLLTQGQLVEALEESKKNFAPV